MGTQVCSTVFDCRGQRIIYHFMFGPNQDEGCDGRSLFVLLTETDDAMLSGPRRVVRGEQDITTIPRSALLRSIMSNHGYHRRGQLTVYLGQAGALISAIYGPSADENPFA
jgi:hypothetical protein